MVKEDKRQHNQSIHGVIKVYWSCKKMSGGPFDGWGKLDGWHAIDMTEVRQLLDFGRGNGEIQAVFGVCYNSLLASGSIIIEPLASCKRNGDGSKLEHVSALDDAERQARSRIFAAWGREGAFVEDCIGWYATTSVPDANAPDGLLPVVMNMSRLEIMHRMDVYGRHFWRWFEVVGMIGGPTVFSELPGRKELFGIRVLGASLPDNEGRISSRIKRIMNGEWAIFQLKKQLTMTADDERAYPMIMTQSAHATHDPNSASSSADASFDQSVPDAVANACRSSQAVHARIRVHNTMGMEAGDAAIASASSSNRSMRRRVQTYDLDEGRNYVNAQLAEAPLELAVARQAYLESACLAWGIPMSMISAGDSTGKSKLNSTTSAPETARIFREAQSNRKKVLECNICVVYEDMFAEQHAQRYIEKELRTRWRKRKMRSRDDYGDNVDGLIDDDDTSCGTNLSPQAIQDATRMRVQIPCNAQSEQLLERLNCGIIKYAAFCAIDAQQLGLTLDSYNESQCMTENAMQINGCAPKPEASTKTKTKK